jgi:F-type H+-transporting ATPase subunit gamma
MPSLREIRRKIKSVRSVTQVTRTMKLVSSVKYAKAQLLIAGARPFANGIEELVRRVACGTEHPFFENDRKGKTGVLLVTSGRGLCGAFNNNIMKKCIEFAAGRPADGVVYYAAGKKGRDFCVRQGIHVMKEYVGIFRNLNYSVSEIISEELMDDFLSGAISSLWTVYSEFSGPGRLRDVAVRLLPVEREKSATGGFRSPRRTQQVHEVEYLYEPPRDQLIDGLMKRYFKAKIYRLLLESNASEQYARMSAMDMATNNANELIDDLTLAMNKQRQMMITKELSEIVGTAEVLRGNQY